MTLKGQAPDNQELSEFLDYLANLYMKIGGFFKLDFQQFMRIPYWVIKRVSKNLDDRQNDLKKFISYEEVSVFKNLVRMFGKNK